MVISTRADGSVVVRGKQHLLAFDPTKREIVWSTKYEAPGVPGWQKAIMGVFAAMSFAEAATRSAHTGVLDSDTRWTNRRNFRDIDSYYKVATKRFTATESTDSYAYILTSLQGEGKKKKRPGIVGVNLDTGKGDREIPLNDKEPVCEVDELSGRVFSVKDEKILTGFSVN